MTQGTNAILPFNGADLQNLTDAIGITQFQGADKWYQTIGGILIQGGRIVGATHPATNIVPFNVGFPTQCLGVFCQAIGTSAHSWAVNNVTTAQFDLHTSSGSAQNFYWWAIGV